MWEKKKVLLEANLLKRLFFFLFCFLIYFFFLLTAETAFCLMADDLNGAQHLHMNLLPSISYANRIPKGLVRKQILKIPIVNFLLSFDLT